MFHLAANLCYQNKFHKSFIIYFPHQDEDIWIQDFDHSEACDVRLRQNESNSDSKKMTLSAQSFTLVHFIVLNFNEIKPILLSPKINNTDNIILISCSFL